MNHKLEPNRWGKLLGKSDGKRRMVFHAPYPIDGSAPGPSRFRAARMREAFEQVGYEIWDASGYTAERRQGARTVRDAIHSGVIFDFCYSESATTPMIMTDPDHIPRSPFLDYRLFRMLVRWGIPVGHFLRDIRWIFPEYRQGLSSFKAQLGLLGYSWDLFHLRRSLTRLYVPSLEMAAHIRTGGLPLAALPPGHGTQVPSRFPVDRLRVLYVGDVGHDYQLDVLIAAIGNCLKQGLNVTLTLCTRTDSWLKWKDHYGEILDGAIRVVHAEGSELQALYDEANLCSLFLARTPYSVFSMPVKMLEYLGHAKPMFAVKGTLMADFIERNEVGWTLEYSERQLTELLIQLARDPKRLLEFHVRSLEVRSQHSWVMRARTVAEDLSDLAPSRHTGEWDLNKD